MKGFLCTFVFLKEEMTSMISRSLYNIGMRGALRGMKLLAYLPIHKTSPKWLRFIKGQSTAIEEIERTFSQRTDTRPVIWVHAASLGEYAVVRPIIQALQAEKKWCIVLTFFSPTGYEALHQKHTDADYVFYLPWDTPAQAERFLSALRPVKALFAVSEYWVNYLQTLKRLQISTYLVSAIITKKAPFFRWYGGIYKDALDAYTQIMVLNESSEKLLRSIGFTRCKRMGDPLFDNAIRISQTPYTDTVIKNFVQGEKVFIAGSTSDKQDLALIAHLIQMHPEIRFIIVPHEVTKTALEETMHALPCKSVLYSQCRDTVSPQERVLIIDFIGALAALYREATWAYVGGGFTPYLHSIIEPVVYGIPVAFGPRIERKSTPMELVERGIGTIVKTEEDLHHWFTALKNDDNLLKAIHHKATTYVQTQAGATETIIREITAV